MLSLLTITCDQKDEPSSQKMPLSLYWLLDLHSHESQWNAKHATITTNINLLLIWVAGLAKYHGPQPKKPQSYNFFLISNPIEDKKKLVSSGLLKLNCGDFNWLGPLEEFAMGRRWYSYTTSSHIICSVVINRRSFV